MVALVAMLTVGAVGIAPGTAAATGSPVDRVASWVVSHRPFTPTDPNLFSAALYGGAEVAPASAPGMSDAQVRADLKAFLRSRFGFFSPRVTEGLRLLDDPALIAKIPSMTLRAALASLLGSAGEPTIASYRDDPRLTNADFGHEDGSAIARSLNWPDGTNTVLFNDQYRYEHYLLFGSILVHERLHSDIVNSDEEERLSLSLQALISLEQVVTRPNLASIRSVLATLTNDYVLARLNSGVGDRMRLYESQGPIFPGSLCCMEYANFSQLYPDEPTAPTPGNPLLDAILGNIAERGNRWTPGGDFQAALTFLDHNHANISPIEQLKAALALKLDVVGAVLRRPTILPKATTPTSPFPFRVVAE